MINCFLWGKLRVASMKEEFDCEAHLRSLGYVNARCVPTGQDEDALLLLALPCRASINLLTPQRKESHMAESVYKVIELVGTSTESWEAAAKAAIQKASHTLRDIRVARIVEQDVHIEADKSLSFRVKLELSFKYEGGA